jgi:hypothetical protein
MVLAIPLDLAVLAEGFRPVYSIEENVTELFRGSGALINISELDSSGSGHLGAYSIKFVKAPDVVKAPSVVEKIQDEILAVFGINISTLADLCKVSAKTPYNWRTSEKIIHRKSKGMDRFFEISKAAKNWKSSGYPNISIHLRVPMVKGMSLFDLLMAEKIDAEAIQFLGARLALRDSDSLDIQDPFS